MERTHWWVVKGTTGSGKTYFVEGLKDQLIANGSPVIFVPQYPMFKPQLDVTKFLKLLPLSKANREELMKTLEELQVPSKGMIGGKLMGMLDIPGLSGGQRKKLLLAVAGAVAREFVCPFIVLDEPFAGVDASAMPVVLKVMEKIGQDVSDLKYVLVTHDHLNMMPKHAVLLVVAARVVTSPGTSYEKSNIEAATEFTKAMASAQTAEPKKRRVFDWYVVNRHFTEQEFMLPLVAYIVFGVLLALVMESYPGGMPCNKHPITGVEPKPCTMSLYNGFDAIWLFMMCFFLEYPHFGNVINYMYKREQHMEDFFLNISPNQFPLLESIFYIVVQQSCLFAVGYAILAGICNFWWIDIDVAAMYLNWTCQDSLSFMLLPLVTTNMLVATCTIILPTVTTIMMVNGILLPQKFAPSWFQWPYIFSPIFNMGCVLKITKPNTFFLPGTDCSSSAIPYAIFVHPPFWFVLLAACVKYILLRRTIAGRKIADLTKSKIGQARSTPSLQDAGQGEALMQAIHGTSDKPIKEGMSELFQKPWWICKGATGSGKTFFLHNLQLYLKHAGVDCCYVAQYPMFKPQVLISHYLRMLPLNPDIKKDLVDSLEMMEVPMPKGKIIGGKLMGMIELKGLSGGQRKKLYIGLTAAVACQFKLAVIVMDEPFAGIDAASMINVTKVLQKAEKQVPGIKFVVSTHDHFDTFGEFATVIDVTDRTVRVANGYSADNLTAALDFEEGLVAASTVKSVSGSFIDFYVIRRHFIEQEFGMPMMVYVIFGTFLGLVLNRYDAGKPSQPGHPDFWPSWSTIFVFMKLFVLEYPCFGSIVNYCFKIAQHQEDYGLSLTKKYYAIFETVVIAIVQQSILVCIATLMLWATSDGFWWVSGKVLLIDIWYGVFSFIGYTLLPVVIPNPMLAMSSLFPYVVCWGFTNGILLPKEYIWVGIRWLTIFSPVWHVACAYHHAEPDIFPFEKAECGDSIVWHIVFICSFTWVILLCLVVKMLRLRLGGSQAAKKREQAQIKRTQSSPNASGPAPTPVGKDNV
jgi:ABC-type Mn2+/Zn2+ transport system ATPase subunit